MHLNKNYPYKLQNNTFVVWKNVGDTPLQALEGLRKKLNIPKQTPMTYAGRLDPLAEGELIILIGDECKNKDQYLKLDKQYEVKVLLGIETDTGDIMGIINKVNILYDLPTQDDLSTLLHSFKGKVSWQYPAFSSKTVHGKPLFLWSLEGRINEIEVPVRESEIYDIELLNTERLSKENLAKLVQAKIQSIKPVPENIKSKRLGADFRREDVLLGWEELLGDKSAKSQSNTLDNVNIIKLSCKCSSGTYMRTLAKEIGKKLSTPALALSITRTNILI